MNTQIQMKNSFLAVILDSNFDQTDLSILYYKCYEDYRQYVWP